MHLATLSFLSTELNSHNIFVQQRDKCHVVPTQYGRRNMCHTPRPVSSSSRHFSRRSSEHHSHYIVSHPPYSHVPLLHISVTTHLGSQIQQQKLKSEISAPAAAAVRITRLPVQRLHSTHR